MASVYIEICERFYPSTQWRVDTNHKDQDIIDHPEILKERKAYEERKQLEYLEQLAIIA